MGEEIASKSFSEEDEREFRKRLRLETKTLKSWFDKKLFDKNNQKIGLELEAWLVSKDFVPAPENKSFLGELNHPLVVPEISKFNFEINSMPLSLSENVFGSLELELEKLWQSCHRSAENLNLRTLMIGTLPTLRDYMLTLENLSEGQRYPALNERVMKLRGDKPIILEIEGKDYLKLEHNDVITECAATSLQVHYGVNQENAHHYYNASIIASSFVAAVAANSPYFYGKELWDESRIAIFEQSVNLKSFPLLNREQATRVTLGNGYVRESIFELFLENLDGYPILLPELRSSDPNWLDHLRLHNGTIWRWNRPLIGLDEQSGPSLRLEFRVPSAGPTIVDTIANLVFQIGLVETIANFKDFEEKLDFKTAKENFYKACRYGLDAEIEWLDGKTHNIQKLLFSSLLDQIEDSLINIGISEKEIQKYLRDIIGSRVQNGQNGANWQKVYIHTHGSRFQEMLEIYFKKQQENIPVHLW